MNPQEKTLSRQLFQNKILKADGQAFEDIFTAIMTYTEPDFQQIATWGNIGDRKNDGYIKSRGIFYQVFAPEEIRKSYPDAVAKLQKDFTGLKEHWSPINEFYFVLNDKYRGVNADCEKAISSLKTTHNLNAAGILTPNDLENILFKLPDDQILSITGFIPDPANIKTLSYSILNEVIGYIMQLSLEPGEKERIVRPDWESKIHFNGLSEPVSHLLANGYFQYKSLDDYLKKNGNFLADALRNKMNEIYLQEKAASHGDQLFWNIVTTASPKNQSMYQSAVIVIMSRYFETCDIFEEPKPDEPV